MMTSTSGEESQSRIGKHIRTRIVSGLLALVPLAITLFILRVSFNFFTAFTRPLLRPWLGVLPDFVIALIALLGTIIMIYLVGLITTHIVGRRLIHFGEKLLMRLPFVKSVYSASKQVVESISSSQRTSYQAVVLVEFPRRGCLALGFVTGTTYTPDHRALYRVFVATTPNPTSGFLLLLPADEVQFTDIAIEEGIKMMVSGGMVAPRNYQIRPIPPMIQS